jgi:hypothetical protein
VQWDEEGTTLAFCGRHTLDYFDWDGTDRDFVKMVATPKKWQDRQNCALGDAIITRRRKSFIRHSVFILLFVIAFLQDRQSEIEGERERYCQEAESRRHG